MEMAREGGEGEAYVLPFLFLFSPVRRERCTQISLTPPSLPPIRARVIA